MDQLTKKYERVNVRLRTDEKNRILAICKQHQISQSDLIRLMLLDDELISRKVNSNINRDAIASVNRCGNNLNQIAKKLNRGEVKIISDKGVKVLRNHFSKIEHLLMKILEEAKGGKGHDNQCPH